MEVEDNLNSSEGSFDLATVNGVSRWLIFTEEIKFVWNLGIGMDGNSKLPYECMRINFVQKRLPTLFKGWQHSYET